jgi:hypothetical protein
MDIAARRRKSLGVFYTDPSVVDFLASWVTQTACSSAMVPACGDGRFLVALAHKGVGRLVGCDVDPRGAENRGRAFVFSPQ